MLELRTLNHGENIDFIVDFLHKNLEKYRDDKNAIKKSIDYAFSSESGKGGFVLLAYQKEILTGVLVMNKTGMSSFIPENILVYIAVDKEYRGQGIGKELIEKAKKESQGDIALHVEYDNPAKILYEKLGFKSKYAEMRFNRVKG
jgi:GNAT superfamily N-acetyltransferase